MSKTVLAVEGSQPLCSVALLCDKGNTIHQKQHTAPRGHSEVFLSMVDALFKEQGVIPRDLEAILFSAGPGAFTGLRISVALVQGLGFAWQVPVISVPSLMSLAWLGYKTLCDPAQNLIVPAFDARMGELYCAAYCFGEEPIPVINDQLCQVSAFQSQLLALSSQYAAWLGLGSGFEHMPHFSSQQSVIIAPDVNPQARSLIELWQAYPSAFSESLAQEAEPVYLRHNVASPKSPNS